MNSTKAREPVYPNCLTIAGIGSSKLAATEAIQRIEENAGLEFMLLDLEIAASARVLAHARRTAPDLIVFGMSRHDALPEAVESIHCVFYKPLVFQELYREICLAAMGADRANP